MSNDLQPTRSFLGELKAMAFLIAFFRKSLEEVKEVKETKMTPLEVAEARLEPIIKRLQNDPDVLDNGRKFHELAGQHFPSSDHEREGFISLLISFWKAAKNDHQEWLSWLELITSRSELESENHALRRELEDHQQRRRES